MHSFIASFIASKLQFSVMKLTTFRIFLTVAEKIFQKGLLFNFFFLLLFKGESIYFNYYHDLDAIGSKFDKYRLNWQILRIIGWNIAETDSSTVRYNFSIAISRIPFT